MGMVLGKVDVEQPKYEIVGSYGFFEVRKYPAAVAATVDQAQLGEDNAFRVLAKYIGVFGKPENESQEGISMTAPVVTEAKKAESIAMTAPVITQPKSESVAMTAPVLTNASAKENEMSFLLPSKYTVETAPKPTDKRVRIHHVPERIVAVHRFSGLCKEKTQQSKAAQLEKVVEREGIKIAGDWMCARYNPPFTLPPLRTNEIHVPVTV